MAVNQPTATLALSTTFTAPSSCAATHNINILPSPGYLIYWNEPFPAPSVTASDCYPKEFLKSYTAVSPSVARALGSSIVPAMSPLVCPEQFCTAFVAASNYIACCPSGYKFATTTSALAVSNRPAYGGICYSDISISQSETAVVYDVNGSSVKQMWSPSTSGAQAYAHLIDGWAPSKATVGCASPSSSSKRKSSSKATKSDGTNSKSAGSSGSGTGSSSSSSNKKKKKKTSGGAIAGAVIGAIVGLIAIIGAVFAWLRKRKQKKYEQAPVEDVHEAGDGQRVAEAGEYNQAPLLGSAPVHQLKGEGTVAEMSAPAPAAELPTGTSRQDTRRE